MKVLFITYHYLNGNGGGVFASRAFINAFAELSTEMTLLYPMKEGAAPEHIAPGIRAIPVWDKRSRLGKGLGLLTGRTNRFAIDGKVIPEEKFDVVVFDTSMVTHGLIDRFKASGARIITIHHNYQYEYFRDNSTFPLRIPTLFWSGRSEREAVLKSDLNLTLTPEDRESFITHYGGREEGIKVIGTFEYKRRPPLTEPCEAGKDNFLITGDLGAKQTVDSLLEWIDLYYPLLGESFPGSSLTLAGRSPSDALLRKAAENGIKVIPSPEDMNPILERAKYYICPVSVGGGIKLRVMDGLRYGLPVVSHKVSARGYEAFQKAGVLLSYDDPASFRRCLEKLKALEPGRSEVIVLYESFFSFESGKERIKKALGL